jgi:hypothetical protein
MMQHPTPQLGAAVIENQFRCSSNASGQPIGARIRCFLRAMYTARRKIKHQGEVGDE